MLTNKNESMEKNCAFQYAKMTEGFGTHTKIVSDETGLTLKESIRRWNEYYRDAAVHIKNGGTVEMVIWINMPDEHSYKDSLHHISTDAESDGNTIWETRKNYFPQSIKPLTNDTN